MTDARAEFLANAKAYAARHPEDQVQARIIASLDPGWTPPVVIPPGRSLDLTAARARLAAASSTPTTPPAKAPAPRPRPLNVGAVRAQREAETAARRPPLAPGGAMRFVADGSWRWAYVDSRLPGARSWLRLTASLVAAGPLRSLDVRQGETVGHGGHTSFHQGDGGAVWASIAVDPAACQGPHHVERVIRHELAHVGDELAKLQTVTAAAWWRSLNGDAHREAQAEAFAVSAEDWLRPDTTAEALISAARAHQAGRRVR
ncbi:hypothetical protein ACIQTN_33835 [Streptomyces werraensis]|uniref:hypothetical protein n=1 Tax=Streptomyces werraensis TaxID=68284 RepID=UPI00382FCB7E